MRYFVPDSTFCLTCSGESSFLNLLGSAKKVDQGEVRDVLGIGIGMAFTPLDGVQIKAGLEFFYEPALACACITYNGKDRSLALFEIRHSLLQLGHLHLSPDQLCSQSGESWVLVGSSLAESTL